MALTALKPSEVIPAVACLFRAKRAPMLHGDPGIGKSQLIEQIADAMFAEKYWYQVRDGVVGKMVEQRVGKKKELEFTWEPVAADFKRPWFKDVRAALLDAVDINGLPYVVDGVVRFARPEFLPSDPRGGIVCLDEINRGQEMTQNALFQWILSNRVGEHVIPDTWLISSAVNDKDAGARKMSAALSARFSHIDMQTDLQDVCALAVQRDWHPAVIAFLRFRPELLHKFDPKERVSPNPRAWDFVSQVVHQDLPQNLEVQLVAGHVGEGAALEFCAFLRIYRSLPSIDGIFLDPQNALVPDQPNALYAVAAAVGRRTTEANIGRAIKYLERLPEEFNVCAVRDMCRRDRSLESTPDITKWQIAHAGVIF